MAEVGSQPETPWFPSSLCVSLCYNTSHIHVGRQEIFILCSCFDLLCLIEIFFPSWMLLCIEICKKVDLRVCIYNQAASCHCLGLHPCTWLATELGFPSSPPIQTSMREHSGHVTLSKLCLVWFLSKASTTKASKKRGNGKSWIGK